VSAAATLVLHLRFVIAGVLLSFFTGPGSGYEILSGFDGYIHGNDVYIYI
jgi:hypothetical protein